MTVRKLSIAMEPELAESAVQAAKAAGVSLSAWIGAAARRELKVRQGLQAVRTWELEHGPLTPEELAEADRALDAAGVAR